MSNLLQQSLISILVSFFLAMVLAPLIIGFLYRNRIVRQTKDFSAIVGDRSLKAGTPIMGGLIIIVVVILLSVLFNRGVNVYILICTMILSAILGGLDDLLNIFGKKERIPRSFSKQLLLIRVHKSYLWRVYLIITLPWNIFVNIFFIFGSFPGRGLQVAEKIVFQLMIGSSIGYWLHFVEGYRNFWIPFVGTFDLGILYFFLVIILVIVMSNAVNITDGMDGLSTVTLLSAFMAYLTISILVQNLEIAMFLGILIGSLLAYLYFNIKPARVEMGDVGSLALGAVLAVTALLLDKVALLPVIGGVFLIEAASSFIQSVYRRLVGRRLFKMAPLHLHFNILGWSEEKTVMRFGLFSVILAIIGVLISMI